MEEKLLKIISDLKKLKTKSENKETLKHINQNILFVKNIMGEIDRISPEEEKYILKSLKDIEKYLMVLN